MLCSCSPRHSIVLDARRYGRDSEAGRWVSFGILDALACLIRVTCNALLYTFTSCIAGYSLIVKVRAANDKPRRRKGGREEEGSEEE